MSNEEKVSILYILYKIMGKNALFGMPLSKYLQVPLTNYFRIS